MAANELEWMENKLLCFVCSQTAVNPRVLKCCCMVGCEECLKRYFRLEIECPFCNKTCGDAPFIRLPFVENLVEILPDLRKCVAVNAACQKHSKANSFYCNECHQYLCSDCLYELVTNENETHSGHEIKKITEMTLQIKDELHEKLKKLDQTQRKIGDDANTLFEFAANIASNKDDILLKMYDRFKIIQDSYSSAIEEHTRDLMRRKDRIEKQNITLERLENDCFAAMESRNISVLSQIPSFLSEVKRTDKSIRDSIEALRPPLPDNDLVPPFATADVRFENFMMLQTEKSLVSEPVEISGNVWRLKLYPSGQYESSKHASVFLELLSGYPHPSRVYHRITVKSVTGQRPDIVQECFVTAELNKSWGWKRFCPIINLQSTHYIGKDGSLTITIGVHPDTYFMLWKWLKYDNDRKHERMMEIRNKLREKK